MTYYQPGVLAMFYNQSEKYSIQTDEFEGKVRIRDHFREPQEDTADEPYLNVAFGFRACRNGDWSVAAYGPDLAKASADEQRLWTSFEILGDEAFVPENEDPSLSKMGGPLPNGELGYRRWSDCSIGWGGPAD